MRAIAEWLVTFFGRRTRRAGVDPVALRDRMTREDPDFAHVREVQHDALNTIGARRMADQLRDRFQERVRRSQSWGQGGA